MLKKQTKPKVIFVEEARTEALLKDLCARIDVPLKRKRHLYAVSFVYDKLKEQEEPASRDELIDELILTFSQLSDAEIALISRRERRKIYKLADSDLKPEQKRKMKKILKRLEGR